MPVRNDPLTIWNDFQALLAREQFARNLALANAQGNLFSPAFNFPHVGTRAARPNQVIYNPDGSSSSERSFSVEVDGRHLLLPSIVPDLEGYLQQRSMEEAFQMYLHGLNPLIGTFDSQAEADAFAIRRSREGGRNQ